MNKPARIAFLIVLLVSNLIVSAQKKKKQDVSAYAFDKDWKSCELKDAEYLCIKEKISDTIFKWSSYFITGSLIYVESYKDEELTIPHGLFSWYDKRGRIDTVGYTSNGRRDKTWYYFTDSSTVWQTETYEKGKLISKQDSFDIRMERENLKGGVDTNRFIMVEVEATFPGGEKSWRKYLEANIKYPERASKLGKTGTVMVSFMVGKDGALGDMYIAQSVEYSLDAEAMRLLQSSPNWIPANQNGRPVKAYRKQPFHFALQ